MHREPGRHEPACQLQLLLAVQAAAVAERRILVEKAAVRAALEDDELLGGRHLREQRPLVLIESGDLVVTSDIPLAAVVVEKGVQTHTPPTELYTDSNIGERLAVRNVLDELRAGGRIAGGPPNFSAKDKQAFANQLDRWMTRARG